MNESSTLDNYQVSWNLEELRGASISPESGHPVDAIRPSTASLNLNNVSDGENVSSGERSLGSIDAVKRPTIKTDSFTISEHGQIKYIPQN
jgi:hypothetical protein